MPKEKLAFAPRSFTNDANLEPFERHTAAQKAPRETMMAERRNLIIIGAVIVAALVAAYYFGYLGVW